MTEMELPIKLVLVLNLTVLQQVSEDITERRALGLHVHACGRELFDESSF